MRIGIFGGTFDPVHYGHLLLAEYCREHCGLDQVWFLPASIPPHKRQWSLSSGEQRVDMLRLATLGQPKMVVSTLEIDRGGVSYTVDTLENVRQQAPPSQLFLLMGADTLNDLPNWKEPIQICTLATPAVVYRQGFPAPNFDVLANLVDEKKIAEIREQCIQMPGIGLSSSEIRQRVNLGRSIRYQTPRSVEEYIHSNEMYCGEGE